MSEILFRAKNLNTRTCRDCGKSFRTPNQDQLCPDCKIKHRKATQKKTADGVKGIRKITEPKKTVPKVSLIEEQRIERIYNAIHKNDKYYGYSEIVSIIENTKADRCVCCGEIIPEGRMVCPVCEAKAERERGTA